MVPLPPRVSHPVVSRILYSMFPSEIWYFSGILIADLIGIFIRLLFRMLNGLLLRMLIGMLMIHQFYR